MSEPAKTSWRDRSWSNKNLAWTGVGAFAAGMVAMYAAGFHWIGNWHTGAEVEHQVAVEACVQEFLLQPERGVIYTQLQETNSAFQRRQLIQNNRWAPTREAAEACDQRIRALDATQFAPPPADVEAEAADPAPA